MQSLPAATLLATAALAAPAHAADVNAFMGDILANPADAATITARCDAWMAEIARRQAALEGETGTASVAGTLQGFDDIANLIASAGGEFTLLREVMADDARRTAAAACEVRTASAQTRLSLSRKVYDRLKAIPVPADAATKLYLARTLASFERAGVALPDAERAQAQALADRIAETGTQFDKAIADGRKTVLADPAELDGLPADYIAAHKPGPDGKIVISTDYPDLLPVMTYAKSEALRRRLYEANVTRAYPANDARLAELLNLRHEFARLLGRKDHASLVLEDKMLDSPARVESLLAEMAGAAKPASERDHARKLAVYRLDHPGATTFNPWDNAYLTNVVQKRDFAYDTQEARQYFEYDEVRDGVLALTSDLFGVTIRPWQTETWHPDVETYEMVEASGPRKGQVIGRFYFDSHPRPGKYNHANMINLRQGVSGRGIPVGALVMNFAKGLMEHGDVETFLHEFGHMLHHVFGGQAPRWAGQSGVATEWDFVEAPSQMLEEWVYDYDTLVRFAKNSAGQVIPRDLVEKMNRARYFDQGMSDMRQLALSNISLRYHQGPAPANLGARMRELDAVYNPLPAPPFSEFQDSFGHLNGYSAIYYTYRWSKVIADDLFTRFEQEGLRNPQTALDYRRKVLEPGGSKPAAQLVADFLGRPISLDAYKTNMAKDR